MSTQPLAGTSARSTGVTWRRPEFILTGLAILGFVTLLINVNTLWAGLPAHPLFVHVPVILIPLSVVGAIVVVARPAWMERYGVLLCLCAIVAMSSIFLAMHAGSALQSDLHLQGTEAQLISQHSSAADKLAILFVAFTAILILAFSSQRISGGLPTGLALVDRPLSSRISLIALRVVLIVLALACAYFVYRVGDLGAKAVWQGRLQAAGAGGPPPAP